MLINSIKIILSLRNSKIYLWNFIFWSTRLHLE